MKTLKKLYSYIDGNKTIIATSGLLLVQELLKEEIIYKTKGVTFLMWLLAGIATGSFIDHVKKGYFTNKKGS